MASATANVRRFVLANGLTVLVKENHASPVAAVLAHVNIGYFNEPDHWGGIAHVVEHMFFKGTRSRPGKEQIAEEVRALGGTINAGTYYDETSYYIVLPSEGVERAIEIQADTFTGGLFDGDELAKEIEVIIQESKQKRDNPGAMLTETMYANAFDSHRIRRWRIGHDDVLRALRREDLVAFVSQTYRPENTTLAVVGDVETERVLGWAERYWGQLERGELIKECSPPEPPRTGFRCNRMRGDIQQRLVQFGFHGPPVLHADTASLMVLGNLLSDGRSSRLYRRLREEERLVSAAWAGYEGFDDIGVFTLGAEALADDPLAAEQGLLREVARVVSEVVEEGELRRIKTRMESRRLFGQEDALAMARHLASYQALGDYMLADDVLERLLAVTSADVQRAAERYLDPVSATLQEVLPQASEAPDRSVAEMAELLLPHQMARKELAPVFQAVPSPAVAEIEIDGGGVALFRRRDDLPIVALHVLFPGGRLAETAESAGTTNLMLKSMLKGAGDLSAEEISARIEGLGSGIGLSMTPDYFGLSMKILASRLEEGIAVVRTVLTSPRFDSAEVEREREAALAEIRRQRDSMSSRAVDLFNAACWGDRPYGLPASGTESTIERLGAEDLRECHRQWVSSRSAVIGIVGSVDEAAVRRIVEGLIPSGDAPQPLPASFERAAPSEQSVTVDKRQTAAVMGFAGAAVGEESRHALDLIAEITSGLAGRFFQAVRGDNALAYAVSSFHRARLFGGTFATYTATSPENEGTARNILLAECRRLREEPVYAHELAAAKSAIRGERVTGLQTFSAQAGELAVNRLYGLPLDAGQRYVERIERLTAEELREAANQYLVEESTWLGVVRGRAGGE